MGFSNLLLQLIILLTNENFLKEIKTLTDRYFIKLRLIINSTLNHFLFNKLK